MSPLLKKLLGESGYVQFEQTNLYIHEGIEDFIIISEYTPAETATFFKTTNAKTTQVLDVIERAQQKGYAAIAKNTSQIICVRVPDLDVALERLNNNFLRIEEDAYVCKKYVLAYTTTGRDALQGYSIPQLQALLYANGGDTFAQWHTRPPATMAIADYGYDLALRLFIKLPFLTLRNHEHEIKGLDAYISSIHTWAVIKALEQDEYLLSGSIDPLASDNNTGLDKWLSRVSREIGIE